MKEQIKNALSTAGYELIDCGARVLTPGDDYPDFASLVARPVGENQQSRGILICGSGVGMCVVANKFKGVRAVLGFSSDQVNAARTDDDVNILCIASDFTKEEEALQMIRTFFLTPFSEKSDYQRRLGKISDIEHA
jgi:ribose 5-phosphate isomerase B